MMTRRQTAVALLLVHALGGAAVTTAHAVERSGAPAAIEAHHGTTCVVVHDALRCAACSWTFPGPAARVPGLVPASPPRELGAPTPEPIAPVARPACPSAVPRAPPSPAH